MKTVHEAQIGSKLRLLDVCECEHVRESLERTHRYVAATASLLLLLFVSSNLCASQRHAGKDREKEQSIQFTPLSGNQPRTPTIPPKKYFYGLVRRLSDFLSALPPTPTQWKALEGDPYSSLGSEPAVLLEGTNAF